VLAAAFLLAVAALSGPNAHAADPLPPWILGINEAVSQPRGRESDAGLDRLTAEAQRVGVQYVRLNASSTPRIFQTLRAAEPDWSEADAQLQRLGTAGMSVVFVVAPWPANEPWNVVESCRLQNPERYAARVEQLVERYDQDGVGDVPGTARVIAWEVDNEPDLHESFHPGFCPPAVHTLTVGVTAAAIKRADPSAKVLNGGIYRPHTQTGKAYMAAAVEAGLLQHIDGVSVHLYPSAGNEAFAVQKTVRNVREVFGGLPLWITETSTIGTGDGTGDRAEAEQARAAAALIGEAYKLGVDAVFWHTLTDPPVKKPGGVPYPGLLAVDDAEREDGRTTVESWRPKPVADVFQRLATARGELTADDELAWVMTDRGALVWSVEPRGGACTTPGAPTEYAGGKVSTAPCGWNVKGVALVPTPEL
jgi:hypothetical protein